MILGIDLALGMSRSFDILLCYQREDTKFHLNDLKFDDQSDFSVSMNYYFAGSDYNFRTDPKFSLHTGLKIGGVNIIPKEDFYRDVWYFALEGHAGFKYHLSRHFGFRFQAQVISQLHPVGAPFLYSMNVYTIPIDASSNLVQIGFSGGVIFRLGK